MGTAGHWHVQFCLVLVRLRRRLSRCSKICSRVSCASLLLELRRLRVEEQQHLLACTLLPQLAPLPHQNRSHDPPACGGTVMPPKVM